MSDKEQIDDVIQAMRNIERALGEQSAVVPVSLGGFNICKFESLVALVDQTAEANRVIAGFALEDSLAYDWDGEDFRGKRIARAYLDKYQLRDSME